MPLADGATFAGYTIVRLLGSGGMGEVLPASVSTDGEYRQRFNREADIAATLWHPHIVGVHDRYALAANAFHLLTGTPPFQNSNPAVVISQHLSASPPAIGAQRPELSALDPVLAKALSKNPEDRFERCADFARALAHRIDGTPTGDVATTLAPTAAPPTHSLLRAGVLVPAILAVPLIAAITLAVTEQGDIPSPTVTTEPTDTPLPTEDESPTRMCMQQTGMTRLQCWESIRRSNRLLP